MASLLLLVIILLDIYLEKILSNVSVKTKIVSSVFKPEKRDFQSVFNKSFQLRYPDMIRSMCKTMMKKEAFFNIFGN